MTRFIPLTALLLAFFPVLASEAAPYPDSDYVIRTPKPGSQPRINGATVYGCRPNKPFIYRIPATGERPMHFSATGLPAGLNLDGASGIITGSVSAKGDYPVTLEATNGHGSSKRLFRIACGDTLALTPPMGWNDWYAYYGRITDDLVRDAADRLITSGMADVGYQFVDIDDCWENAPKSKDPARVGTLRDSDGNIVPNRFFPDMKAMTDYIHSKGLRAGIYSSPGILTCGGYAGSLGHEEQDARQYALWGFDLLKYDWCSYSRVAPAKGRTVEMMQKPYRLMGGLLEHQDRDIVLNLCQYGMGDVWKWGPEVGAQSWRTAGDLGPRLDHIFDVAIANIAHREWSKPGSWNDPDYIQIGWVGNAHANGLPQPSNLLPEQQYSFMSLWCLMASPLFYSWDLTHLDPFTLNILCNPEVIDVDQDPLGQCARFVGQVGDTFVLEKDLADGGKAIGLCNRSPAEATVTVTWKDLGLADKQSVRDLWREKDLGDFQGSFSASVPSSGVVLVRVNAAQ